VLVEVDERKVSYCDKEYVCTQTALAAIIEADSISWTIPMQVCSYDIETMSKDGDFPMPLKDYRKVATYLVDAIERQPSCAADQKNFENFVKKILQKAFQLMTMRPDERPVPLLYPKTSVTKTLVNTWVDKIIASSIADMACTIDPAQWKEVNAILEGFSRAAVEEDNGGGRGEEEEKEREDSTEEEEEDEGGMDVDEEEEDDDREEEERCSGKKRERSTIWTAQEERLVEDSTLMNMLTSTAISRAEKITIVNKVMSGCFPSLHGDNITFIGCSFLRYGETDPYVRHSISVGPCDPVPGVIMHYARSERELLLEWKKLIVEVEDPDMLIGYNLFGFDCQFMFLRAKELGIEYEFLQLSRLRNHVSGIHCDRKLERVGELPNTTLELASGTYQLRYFEMPGRIHLDLYQFFRKEYSTYNSFKLDDVVSENIQGAITTVLSPNQFETNQNIGLYAGDYIKIRIQAFTANYMHQGKKFLITQVRATDRRDKKGNAIYQVDLSTEKGEEGLDMTESKALKWCMAKDDLPPDELFKKSEGSMADRALVAKYCIKDCDTVLHLFRKMDVMTGYMEMSKVCTISLNMLIFRGQGIKLHSFVARECLLRRTLMPDLFTSFDNSGYEGALVLEPKRGMYIDEPVACLDYNSLYPSIMSSENYSHDSKVSAKEFLFDKNDPSKPPTEHVVFGERDAEGRFIYDNLPGYEYSERTFHLYRYEKDPRYPARKAVKKLVGYKTCRWAIFPNGEKGILPAILLKLMAARKETRLVAKRETDTHKCNILDKRQLTYKLTANSLYGVCGARTSALFEKDIAACTCACGREMIHYAKEMVETVYHDRVCVTECEGPVRVNAEYIYGDTDSVFFKVNPTNVESGEKIVGKRALRITIELAQEAARISSLFLKAPMNLEYEKTMLPFFICTKKRYAGLLYEKDSEKPKELKFMGLANKRRGVCDYFKDAFGETLEILFYEQDFPKMVTAFEAKIQNLIDGNVPIHKLSTTSQLRSGYKNPQSVKHWVLSERIAERDPGNRPKPGDRIEFVHVLSKQKIASVLNKKIKILQGDTIETVDYVEKNNLKIDHAFYITNHIMKPYVQFFSLAAEKLLEMKGMHKELAQLQRDVALIKSRTNELGIFEAQRSKLFESKSKGILFDKYLRTLNNRISGNRSIHSLFNQA
jgi:DNA polymerase elongation subunit (family B)